MFAFDNSMKEGFKFKFSEFSNTIQNKISIDIYINQVFFQF
jgi:hypothetical protein